MIRAQRGGPTSRVGQVALASLLFMAGHGDVLADPGGAQTKKPWQWTAEERIAKRVNPAEREARRARGVAKAQHGQPAWTPIDGSVEPELFLPVELVTRLVLNSRIGLRGAIESHGWNYERFWEVLDSAAAPYLSLMRQAGALQREARGHADVTQLSLQICAVSAELLETAYKTFGEQQFKEFLYRDVARPIRTSIADHADTAEVLRNRDRGCRP